MEQMLKLKEESEAAGGNPITMINNNTDASVKTSSTNNNLIPDNPVDVDFINQTRLGFANYA